MRSGRQLVALAFVAAVLAGCGRGPMPSMSMLPNRVNAQALIPPTNPVVTPVKPSPVKPKPPSPNWPGNGGSQKCYPHVPCFP
jgi:hypothetical protein